MRKRRAILLFGGFTVLLLTYVAWCLSPFFRQLDVGFDHDISLDARAAVLKWRPYQDPVSNGVIVREIMRNLASPYKVGRFKAYAFSSGADDRYFSLSAPPFSATIVRRNGKWVWEPLTCHVPAM